MEEKEIIKSKPASIPGLLAICFSIPVVLFVVLMIYCNNTAVSNNSWGSYYHWTITDVLVGSMVFEDFVGACLFYVFAVFLIFGLILFFQCKGNELTVTDKRVYGRSRFGKRVDLPIDSISAVGTGAFKSLAVTSASGAIKFMQLENRDEIHQSISNLLMKRQENNKKQQLSSKKSSKATLTSLKNTRIYLTVVLLLRKSLTKRKNSFWGCNLNIWTTAGAIPPFYYVFARVYLYKHDKTCPFLCSQNIKINLQICSQIA